MTILVTGANGFTGSHVVKALCQRGIPVRAMVRHSSDRHRLQGLCCDLTEADLSDPASLERAVQGVKAIIHTAAYVDLGIVDEARMMAVNYQGTCNLLDAACQHQVDTLVYCSTIGIYGDTQGETADEHYQRWQQTFSSAYDHSKFLAQQQVDQAIDRGLKTVSVMPSGIFGKGDPHFGPVIQRFLQGRLPFWAGGERMTGIVDVEDLAGLLILSMDAPAGEHFIASAGELKTREIFNYLAEQTSLKPPAELPPWLVRLVAGLMEPVGRIGNFNPPLSKERVHYLYDRCVRVDGSKARQQLGWNPKPVQQILYDLLP